MSEKAKRKAMAAVAMAAAANGVVVRSAEAASEACGVKTAAKNSASADRAPAPNPAS